MEMDKTMVSSGVRLKSACILNDLLNSLENKAQANSMVYTATPWVHLLPFKPIQAGESSWDWLNISINMKECRSLANTRWSTFFVQWSYCWGCTESLMQMYKTQWSLVLHLLWQNAPWPSVQCNHLQFKRKLILCLRYNSGLLALLPPLGQIILVVW